jgi:hypothetical protein
MCCLEISVAGLGISQSIGKSVVKSELTRLRFDCCSIVQLDCFSVVAESVGYLGLNPLERGGGD